MDELDTTLKSVGMETKCVLRTKGLKNGGIGCGRMG